MTRQDLNRKVTSFLTPVKTVVRESLTLADALKEIREKNIHEKIVYFYVVDDHNTLLGVVSTRKLLLADPDTLIRDIMDKSVIVLNAEQTLREALDFFGSHHLLALPVVDDDHQFMGVIDVDLYLEESVDLGSSRRRREVFQLIGITLEEGKKFELWKNYWNRMPWITCNIFGGLLCAAIANMYEMVLSQAIVIAMFIPLLLTLSESISMQSATTSLQMIRHPNVNWPQSLRALYNDARAVFLLSVTCALIVSGFSLLWGDGVGPAIVIGGSIFVSVMITSFIGAATPILLHHKKWDPKVAAGPVVLMFADVLTTFMYLTIAFLLLMP